MVIDAPVGDVTALFTKLKAQIDLGEIEIVNFKHGPFATVTLNVHTPAALVALAGAYWPTA